MGWEHNLGIPSPELSPINATKTIFVIGLVSCGGVRKYIADLVDAFPDTRFTTLSTIDELRQAHWGPSDILLINHLINIPTPDIWVLPITRFTGTVIVVVHDMWWITPRTCREPLDIHRSYLHPESNPMAEFVLKTAGAVVFPSRFVRDIYTSAYDIPNSVVVPHIDLALEPGTVHRTLTRVSEHHLRIGVFVDNTPVKGCGFVTELMRGCASYRGHTVTYAVVDRTIERYNDDQFEQHLQQHRVNGLLLLSRYGETYSFALTKHLRCGLPLLYNNFGAHQERIPSSDHYIVCYSREEECDRDAEHGFPRLFCAFHQFLDFLVDHSTDRDYECTPTKLPVWVPGFYKDHFTT